MVSRRVAALTIAALALPALTSCYTTRVLSGGAGILSRRKPVEKVLASGELPPEQQRQLELTQRLREFAIAELGLPDNGSYTTFVQIDGRYVTWNVVAAPELSVEPLTWCFPIAGCVSYRGYFKEKRARKFAAGLEAKGNDVHVGGVDAYSTLGRYKDPVLSTFFSRRDTDLAGLLFHEMAHQRLYVKATPRSTSRSPPWSSSTGCAVGSLQRGGTTRSLPSSGVRSWSGNSPSCCSRFADNWWRPSRRRGAMRRSGSGNASCSTSCPRSTRRRSATGAATPVTTAGSRAR